MHTKNYRVKHPFRINSFHLIDFYNCLIFIYKVLANVFCNYIHHIQFDHKTVFSFFVANNQCLTH